jgi:hypothetical protein
MGNDQSAQGESHTLNRDRSRATLGSVLGNWRLPPLTRALTPDERAMRRKQTLSTAKLYVRCRFDVGPLSRDCDLPRLNRNKHACLIWDWGCISRSGRMKTLPMASIAFAACVVLTSAGVALAAQPGTNAGVNCGSVIPGGSASSATPNGGAGGAKGSPFSGGTSGAVYANAFNGTGSQATTNTHATSQYDIACKNVTPP